MDIGTFKASVGHTAAFCKTASKRGLSGTEPHQAVGLSTGLSTSVATRALVLSMA